MGSNNRRTFLINHKILTKNSLIIKSFLTSIDCASAVYGLMLHVCLNIRVTSFDVIIIMISAIWLVYIPIFLF